MSNAALSWARVRDSAGTLISDYRIKYRVSMLSPKDNGINLLVTFGYEFSLFLSNIAEFMLTILFRADVWMSALETMYERIFTSIYLQFAPILIAGTALTLLVVKLFAEHVRQRTPFRLDRLFTSFGFLCIVMFFVYYPFLLVRQLLTFASTLATSMLAKNASSGSILTDDSMRVITTRINYHTILSSDCLDKWSEVFNGGDYSEFAKSCLVNADLSPQNLDIILTAILWWREAAEDVLVGYLLARVFLHLASTLWYTATLIYKATIAVFKDARFDNLWNQLQKALAHLFMALVVTFYASLTFVITEGIRTMFTSIISALLGDNAGDNTTLLLLLSFVSYVIAFMFARTFIGGKSDIVQKLRATPPQSWVAAKDKLTGKSLEKWNKFRNRSSDDSDDDTLDSPLSSSSVETAHDMLKPLDSTDSSLSALDKKLNFTTYTATTAITTINVTSVTIINNAARLFPPMQGDVLLTGGSLIDVSDRSLTAGSAMRQIGASSGTQEPPSPTGPKGPQDPHGVAQKLPPAPAHTFIDSPSNGEAVGMTFSDSTGERSSLLFPAPVLPDLTMFTDQLNRVNTLLGSFGAPPSTPISNRAPNTKGISKSSSPWESVLTPQVSNGALGLSHGFDELPVTTANVHEIGKLFTLASRLTQAVTVAVDLDMGMPRPLSTSAPVENTVVEKPERFYAPVTHVATQGSYFVASVDQQRNMLAAMGAGYGVCISGNFPRNPSTSLRFSREGANKIITPGN